MKTVRVLVVDDSAYNRRTIAELLGAIPGVVVAGKASDGDEALRMVAELRPDAITLDLEMPRMDGFTFLRLLMAKAPTPVIVVSGYSAKENVFRALELGALDFVAKPTRTVSSDLSSIRDELQEKIQLVRHLTPTGCDPHGAGRTGRTVTDRLRAYGQETSALPEAETGEAPRKLVVVGASTGGPTALLELFGGLDQKCGASFLVAQHMPERFTTTFAERLDRLGGVRVAEATGRHALFAGYGWLCPGGQCLEVAQGAAGLLEAYVRPGRPEDRYVPSIDALFTSAAKVFGGSVIAVVLTGMGDDASTGVKAVRKAGGVVLAESEETAVIYGMPRAAERTGAVDHVLPLGDLAATVREMVGA